MRLAVLAVGLSVMPCATEAGGPEMPGSVALLVEQMDVQAARARVVDALRSPVPLVRSVAARVAFVGGLAVTAPLVEALHVEKDPEAALEQVRALLPITDALLDGSTLGYAESAGVLGPAS